MLNAVCFVLLLLTKACPDSCRRAYRAGALDAMLDIMRAHPLDGLQNLCCVVLLRMCQVDEAMAAAAMQLGAPAVLIDALRAFPDNIALQAHAYDALAVMLPSEPTADNYARLPGAVSCIIHALRSHAAVESVQLHACKVLELLTKNQPGNAAEAWRLGAFPLLISTLEVHKMQPAVLEQCLAAACDMIYERRSTAGSACTPTPADTKAAVSAFVAAMGAFPARRTFYAVACGLVSKLAFFDAPLAVAAAEAGAMEAMVHALKSSAPWTACWALIHLATNAPNCRHRAHAAGAVDALTTVMRRESSANSDMQERMSNALGCLCLDDTDACAQAVRCGAVKLLCGFIVTRLASPKTLKLTLSTLDILVDNDVHATAEVVALGPAGIGVVTQLLLNSASQQDGVILFGACKVLAKIAASEGAAVRSVDTILTMLQALNVCAPLDPQMATTVCRALVAIFVSSPAHAAEAAKRDAAAVVNAAARLHPADAELQLSASRIQFLLTHVEADRRAEAMADALTADARAEAERRGAAMAAALIAEEEAEAAARAAPQAGRVASATRRSAAAAATRPMRRARQLRRAIRGACRSRGMLLLKLQQRWLRWHWTPPHRLRRPCAAAGAPPPSPRADWRSVQAAQQLVASPLPPATLSRRTRRTKAMPLTLQQEKQCSPRLRRPRRRRLSPPQLPRRRRQRLRLRR